MPGPQFLTVRSLHGGPVFHLSLAGRLTELIIRLLTMKILPEFKVTLQRMKHGELAYPFTM